MKQKFQKLISLSVMVERLKKKEREGGKRNVLKVLELKYILS